MKRSMLKAARMNNGHSGRLRLTEKPVRSENDGALNRNVALSGKNAIVPRLSKYSR